jgi:hypothetical protein
MARKIPFATLMRERLQIRPYQMKAVLEIIMEIS